MWSWWRPVLRGAEPPSPSWLIDPGLGGGCGSPAWAGPQGSHSLCLMTAESHYSSLSCKQLSTALIRATEERREPAAL